MVTIGLIALAALVLLLLLLSLWSSGAGKAGRGGDQERRPAAPPAPTPPVSAPAAKREPENPPADFRPAEGPGPLSRSAVELETLWRLEHLLRELQNPASGVVTVDFSREPREVALALASNPLYAARILKTVNSAAFGLRRRIDSLPRAITFLGYNQVKNIVFQGLAKDNLGAAEASCGFDPAAFWRHSHAVSVAAEHVLRELGATAAGVGLVTTAALLHDIGWIVFERFDRQAAAALFDSLGHGGPGDDPLELERRWFGFDHPLAGSLLAGAWSIPEGICRLIWLHHAAHCGLPPGLDRETATGAAVISLAESLAAACGYPHPLAEPLQPRYDLGAVLGPKAAAIGADGKLRQELERTMKLIDEFSRSG